MWLKGGFTLSACPSVDRIGSALYLQQYSSDPFHICISYQAASEVMSPVKFVSKFEILANSLNLSLWLSLLLTWIQYDSIGFFVKNPFTIASHSWLSLMVSLLENDKLFPPFLLLVESKLHIMILVFDSHFWTQVTDPKVTQTTQPSPVDGSLGEPGFSTLDSIW